MKVLQIIDSLATGGAEKLILDSLPLYRKAGIKMDVLVLKDNHYPFMKALKDKDCCKVYVLGSGSVYNLLHIFKIAKILPKYDLAHVHLFPAQYWVVLAKFWSKAKTKLIFTEHNTSNKRVEYKLLSKLDRVFYKKYDRIIAISQEIQNIFLIHTRLPKDKFDLILNGVNISNFLNASENNKLFLGFTQDDFLIIQVSAFRLQKDQPTLIKSLKHLPDHFKLLMVGDGVLRQDCAHLVKQLKLNNRVHFLGNRSDVPSLLKTADVVVLSSYYEGMSLSSIEGMASGKPFVASDVPGLRNMVKDAGILFKQGDEKALAEIIKELAENKFYYNNTVKNCIMRAQKFEISKMVKNYIGLYKDVLEK